MARAKGGISGVTREVKGAPGSLKVAVVMGGPSEEHAISLKSGHGVAEALTRRGWLVEALELPHSGGVAQACEAARHTLQRTAPDVVFIALHGAFGEDGTIQSLCEELKLAYTGSDAAASRIGMDKVASRRRFEAAHLAVPPWRLVDGKTGTRARIPEGLAVPLVVKPVSQGSSIGVSIVRQEEEFPRAVAEAAQYGSPVLVEGFVAGRELTVGVLGEQALPVIEIHPKQGFFDFSAKYTAGQTEYLVPAPIPAAVAKQVQAVGLAAHKAIGCRHLSRTDIILTPEGRAVVLEVNTIPGFTPTSLLPKAAACIGLAYEDVCEQLVMMAWHGTTHVARACS